MPPEICGNQIRCPLTHTVLAEVPVGTPAWLQEYQRWESIYANRSRREHEIYDEGYDAGYEAAEDECDCED